MFSADHTTENEAKLKEQYTLNLEPAEVREALQLILKKLYIVQWIIREVVWKTSLQCVISKGKSTTINL